MHDEFGQLVPRPIETENESSKNDSRSKKPALARGGSLRRLPLKNKDPNVKFGSEYEKPSETNDWFQPPGMVQSAVLAASAKRSETGSVPFERKNKPEIKPAFRVFDETGSSKPRSSNGRVEGLLPMTSKLRITDDEERTPAEQKPPATTADNDAEVLLLMLERLTTVLDTSKQQEFSYAPGQVKPASRGAPTKWITRYVDYTSKYGLGFLMNDSRYVDIMLLLLCTDCLTMFCKRFLTCIILF